MVRRRPRGLIPSNPNPPMSLRLLTLSSLPDRLPHPALPLLLGVCPGRSRLPTHSASPPSLHLIPTSNQASPPQAFKIFPGPAFPPLKPWVPTASSSGLSPISLHHALRAQAIPRPASWAPPKTPTHQRGKSTGSPPTHWFPTFSVPLASSHTEQLAVPKPFRLPQGPASAALSLPLPLLLLPPSPVPPLLCWVLWACRGLHDHHPFQGPHGSPHTPWALRLLRAPSLCGLGEHHLGGLHYGRFCRSYPHSPGSNFF